MKIATRINSLEDFKEMLKNETLDIYSNSYTTDEGCNINICELYDGIQRDVNNLVFVTFNDKDSRKYIANPKLLAFDYYGNNELFWTINSLNNITMAADLSETKLKSGLIMLNRTGIKLIESLQITPQRIELFEDFRF